MTTQESRSRPDAPADSPGSARTGPNWGRVDCRCLRGSASSGSLAAMLRMDVDPRVANPNVEGRPRPVESLSGFDHWQVIPQVGALIMVVVLTIVFIVAGGKTPAARCC